MIRLWVQFNYQNIHNFNFWPNLAILKPRIYSKLQNTQSLGYKFEKKFQLRRWCKFLLENHEKSRFCHTRWRRLDAAIYLISKGIFTIPFLAHNCVLAQSQQFFNKYEHSDDGYL